MERVAGAGILMASGVNEDEESQDSPFDRLEGKINSLIERYQGLQKEYRESSLQLAEREARIQHLEEQVRKLEEQRAEARRRLDGLIERLTRIA